MSGRFPLPRRITWPTTGNAYWGVARRALAAMSLASAPAPVRTTPGGASTARAVRPHREPAYMAEAWGVAAGVGGNDCAAQRATLQECAAAQPRCELLEPQVAGGATFEHAECMVTVALQLELYRASRLLPGADATVVAVAENSSFAANKVNAGGAPAGTFSALTGP